MKRNHQLFEVFDSKITESKLYKKYKMKLIAKAAPSHGFGELHGNKEMGIEVYGRLAKAERAELHNIFLHGKNHKKIKAFADELPGGISFDMSREQVQKTLGKPDWSIEKGGEGIFATTNSADKWFTENKEGYRVEYETDDKRIVLITIICTKQEAEWA